MKIALAFSGGGFRAAAFNLGVLAYLNRINRLKDVCILSTVSGGTITGARYAIGQARGESFEEFYKELYDFMTTHDLVSGTLRELIDDKNWHKTRSRGLITSFADQYDTTLFKGALFDQLLNPGHASHLRDVSFNATEFTSPLQFRFQTSGIIGNKPYTVPKSVAKGIRMGDIVAASSCFPTGFEPINFPGDFIIPEEIREKEEYRNLKPIGLMDGGIVDNQGLDPILLADERMRKEAHHTGNDGAHAIDLIIACDVASPFMKKYVATEQQPFNWWRSLTPSNILVLNNLILIGALYGIFRLVSGMQPGWLILSSVFAALTLAINILIALALVKIRKIDLVRNFRKPLRTLLRLKLGVFETLLINRFKSVIKLVGSVFLKQIRKMHYDTLYKYVLIDENKNLLSWKNRLIMNAVYELVVGKGKKKAEDLMKLNPELLPSARINEVAKRASEMDTTLWFTRDELNPANGEKAMPDTIIACGEFTLCWNLLEYIEKIKKDDENTTPDHQSLICLREQILKDWNQFKSNPYCMVQGEMEEFHEHADFERSGLII